MEITPEDFEKAVKTVDNQIEYHLECLARLDTIKQLTLSNQKYFIENGRLPND